MAEKKRLVWERASWAFFVLCFAGTALYLSLNYGAYLDADMSAELVLAEHLADIGRPVSSTWYYSTEVRLLSTQLVFAPLMALFSENWALVRTLGDILLLAVMGASILFAAAKLGTKPAYARVFAGLALCFGSPLYAQNVIIGAYYVPHAGLALLMLGLFADLLKHPAVRKGEAVFMACFAAVLGLSSARYVLQILAPMAGAVFFLYLFPAEGENEPRTRAQKQKALWTLGILAAGGIGYLLGEKLLPAFFHYEAGRYGSAGYADWMVHDLGDQIQCVLAGLLSVLGFTGGVPLFTAHGIANALVLLEIITALWLLVRNRRNAAPVVRFAVLTAGFAALLSLGTFVLLRSVYFDRYWLPVIMVLPPVLALVLSGEKNAVLRRCVLVLFVGTTLLVSAMCSLHAVRYPQVKIEDRMEAVDMAREKGVTRGYATFWNSGILTELSDGELTMAPVEFAENEEGEQVMRLNRWLVDERDLEMNDPDKPVFLLLEKWEEAGMQPFLSGMQAERTELPGHVDFYLIPSQKLFFDQVLAPL